MHTIKGIGHLDGRQQLGEHGVVELGERALLVSQVGAQLVHDGQQCWGGITPIYCGRAVEELRLEAVEHVCVQLASLCEEPVSSGQLG